MRTFQTLSGVFDWGLPRVGARQPRPLSVCQFDGPPIPNPLKTANAPVRRKAGGQGRCWYSAAERGSGPAMGDPLEEHLLQEVEPGDQGVVDQEAQVEEDDGADDETQSRLLREEEYQ